MGWLANIWSRFMNRFDTRKIEKTFGIKVSVPSDMSELIADWEATYQGVPRWVGKGETQVRHSLSLASTIVVDLAIKAVSEISVDCGNEYADRYVRQEILPELRQQAEYALATGSVVARPYYDSQLKRVCVSWYTADRFIPVDWVGRRCMSGVFVDQFSETKNGSTTYYTKLELQKWNYAKDGMLGSVDITVKAFKSSNPTELSTEISLSSVPAWADITPKAEVSNLTAPMFVYMGTPFTNNKSFNSKAGVSIFKDGMSLLEEIDRTWNALIWEREYTEGKIFVDADMLEMEHDENGELVTKINSKDKRVYRVLDAQGKVGKYMEVFSPAIRQADYTAMLKTNLSLLCSACHLDSGAYIYDEQAQAITATEVRTKNQKTYQTLVDFQEHTITPAIRQIIESVRLMQSLYNVQELPMVEPIINYGDSILVDAESDKQNAQRETQMGLRSKLDYLMTYRGLTEEDARKELAQISTETPASLDFFGGMTE